MRRCAPTPLRCSERGRAAQLATLTFARSARTGAASQTTRRADARRPRSWPCRPRRALRSGRSQGTSRPPDGSCPCSPTRRPRNRPRRRPPAARPRRGRAMAERHAGADLVAMLKRHALRHWHLPLPLPLSLALPAQRCAYARCAGSNCNCNCNCACNCNCNCNSTPLHCTALHCTALRLRLVTCDVERRALNRRMSVFSCGEPPPYLQRRVRPPR